MNKHAMRWNIAVGLVCVSFAAQAETAVIKANNILNLNVGTSWTRNYVPGVGDLPKWDSTVTAENTVLLGANVSYAGLWIVNPGGNVFIGGTNTLTVGCQGIRMNTATMDLSLTNTTVALRDYVTPAWNVASGRTLTVAPSNLVRGVQTCLSVPGPGTVTCEVLTNDAATGIIGPWARCGTGTSTKYATASGGSIVGYSSGSSVTAAGVTDTAGVMNYDVTAAGTVGTGASFNTLRYTGPAGALTGNFQASGLLNAGAGALTFNSNVTIGQDKELVLISPDTTRTLTFSGIIGNNPEGASGVTVTGGGNVMLTTSNAYDGVTVVSQGRLTVSDDNALGTTNGSTVIVYSGGTASGGGLILKGNVTIADPIAIYGGELEGGIFAIQNASSGETNTLTGPIIINDFNHTRIAASAGSVLNINGAITSQAGSLVLAAQGGTIYVNKAFDIGWNTLYFHGNIGAVVLNSASNIFGTVLVQFGNILRLGVTNAVYPNRTITVGNGTGVEVTAGRDIGNFDLAGMSQTINHLYGYPTTSSSTATPYTSRVITNSAAASSTLTVGSANGDSYFDGLITDGAGTIALAKIGTGLLTLSGVNRYSGDTAVSGGTLVISNELALQKSTLTCTDTGAVRFSRVMTAFTFGGLAGAWNAGLTNEAGTAIALTVGNNNNDTTYSGALSAGGSLTKTGTGTLTLAGPNTYTGATRLTDGTLALGCDNALAASDNFVLSGGTLAPGTFSNTFQSLTVTGAGTFALGDGLCHLAFSDSSGETWTGTLNIVGTLRSTSLRFGTNASGLTAAQVKCITVDGEKAWLELNDQGYLLRRTGTLFSLR